MSQKSPKDSLKQASRGAALGVFIYFLLTILKLLGAYFFKSDALQADGLNNLSDIISSVAVWIGLKISQKPSDDDHHFDHNKYETLASFVTSLLMFTIGFEVIRVGITKFYQQSYANTSAETLWISLFSAIVLFVTASYNMRLAKKTKSLGLKSSAKDMFSDMLISVGSMVGAIGAICGYPQTDTIMAIVIGFVILWTALEIFKDSSFVLSDGFDQQYLDKYQASVRKIKGVERVHHVRGRRSGMYIYVDITIEVNQDMSVYDSHKITEKVEKVLFDEFGVRDVDVHVEPYL